VSAQLPTYSFLPWLRRGIANTLTTADGDTTVHTRAGLHVDLQLTGNPVGAGPAPTAAFGQDIALYGPGDLVGVDGRVVVRTEPRNWITNFESNYLPAIDFYDEDFPWRYTPAAPSGDQLRLRPWIALVVLTEQEFAEAQDISGRPLPYVTVPDASVFPPAGDLWAWAHVHLNQSVAGAPGEIVSTDVPGVTGRVQTLLSQNPDLGYARLLCPRRLADNTAYHAFLMPTFETGRLAGLGLDPTAGPYATASAWADYAGRQAGTQFPFYLRWYFRTGTHGDFEYLVRLLTPQPVDPRVGTRDMDVLSPGANLPGIANLGGILRLGGALQVPDTDLDAAQLAQRQAFENWDQPFPHPFEHALAAFIDLPDDYSVQTAADANSASGLGAGVEDDPDPLITAPLYGQWHALTQRLLTNRDGTPAPNPQNWVHRVNLDPRFRVAAGFGADVVQANQEAFVDDAWQQVGDVLAANSRIRFLHLATEVAARWFTAQVQPLATAQPERAFALTAPVHARILGSPTTIAAQRRASLVPPVLTSAPLRRATRPGARLLRSLPFTAAITPGNLLARVNAGDVSAAPPKVVPPGVVTVGIVAGAAPAGPGGWWRRLVTLAPWLPWLLIALGVVACVLLSLLGPAGIAAGLVVLIVLVLLALRLLAAAREPEPPASGIGEGDQKPGAVTSLPDNPGFVLTVPGAGTATPAGASDSVTAVRFKTALRASYALVDASRPAGAAPVLASLDLAALTGTAVAGVNPRATVLNRGFSTVALAPWIIGQRTDDFGEVMAYPRIDLPMYAPLKEISAELFLPNINLIPPNSITLVETNQRFIEAYMVGLNHEFARELLWQEYPTDQRGSYFRQFWDVRSVINTAGLSEDALREQLYDIPELHRWSLTSALGTHNNRDPSGTEPAQAVLVIRGELLKKYPTAVIYAHRAGWEYLADGRTPDLTKPRILVPLLPAEETTPPPSKVRMPLYEAKADPDIYFFGFDLTVPEAKGGTGHPPDTDPGWFFVIKERPGEPRFGLEVDPVASPEVIDELSWPDAVPGIHDGDFLPAAALGSVTLTHPPTGDPEGKLPQYTDDEQALAAAVSSARWAYELFRPPVMVAVHADEMLR
jgi:hypothetical protein